MTKRARRRDDAGPDGGRAHAGLQSSKQLGDRTRLTGRPHHTVAVPRTVGPNQVDKAKLSYSGEFDAVLTIDAMENVPSEDWPLVLANLHRALRTGGSLYVTVEEVPQPVIQEAFETLTGRGLPAVRGEITEGNVAGYHYYPSRDRVIGWFNATGLQIIDEGFEQEDGWGYRHFLLRNAAQ
jgi:hypothetical protein